MYEYGHLGSRYIKSTFFKRFSFCSLQQNFLKNEVVTSNTPLFVTCLFCNTRSSRPEVFLVKGCLKICSKFTREHSCQSAISIKLQSNFIEIALWHRCSSVNLLHIFRTPFLKETSRWLLLSLLSPVNQSATSWHWYTEDFGINK